MKVSTFLSTAILALGLGVDTVLAGNFMATCGPSAGDYLELYATSDWYWTLTTKCYSKSREKILSALYLSRCILNSSGVLHPLKDGGFSGSCTECYLEDTSTSKHAWMNCKCLKGSGPRLTARIDLSECSNVGFWAGKFCANMRL